MISFCIVPHLVIITELFDMSLLYIVKQEPHLRLRPLLWGSVDSSLWLVSLANIGTRYRTITFTKHQVWEREGQVWVSPNSCVQLHCIWCRLHSAWGSCLVTCQSILCQKLPVSIEWKYWSIKATKLWNNWKGQVSHNNPLWQLLVSVGGNE